MLSSPQPAVPARYLRMPYAAKGLTVGLFKRAPAGDGIVDIGVEQSDDSSVFGSRPRPAEGFGMGGCHGVGSFNGSGYLPP